MGEMWMEGDEGEKGRKRGGSWGERWPTVGGNKAARQPEMPLNTTNRHRWHCLSILAVNSIWNCKNIIQRERERREERGEKGESFVESGSRSERRREWSEDLGEKWERKIYSECLDLHGLNFKKRRFFFFFGGVWVDGCVFDFIISLSDKQLCLRKIRNPSDTLFLSLSTYNLCWKIGWACGGCSSLLYKFCQSWLAQVERF